VKKQAAQGNGEQPSGADAETGNGTTGGSGSRVTNTTPSPSSGAGPSTGAPKPGLTFAPGVPETDALRKCLNLWGTTPFKEVKASQVKVMDVSVGVGGGLLGSGLGGLGNLINIGNPKDLESTAEPRLVVLPLSVNVGANTTFELMNPNGWYCMKAAVGARSTVNIKLHCSAKIAQSDLGIRLDTKPSPAPGGAPALPVNVGINDGRTPGSQLGIMVDSNVNLTRVDSAGNACPP
jgi:hypothetical protein